MNVEMRPGSETINVLAGGTLFTRYHFGAQWAKPYFYPVLTPGGIGVTRGFPMDPKPGESGDHPHQKSLWVAHGAVNGHDLWSEEPGHGRQVQRGLQTSGDTFTARNDWLDRDGRKLLSEARTVRAGQTDAFRWLELAVDLLACEGDVVLGDTKEGGLLSVRVATTMDAARDGRIENSEGHVYAAKGGATGPCTPAGGGEPTWGKRARWVTYTGPAEGRLCGVTVLDHPANVRHPTYWHVRGYGLFTANPFGVSHFTEDPEQNGSFAIRHGEHLRQRYCVLVHDGALPRATIDRAFRDFAA